METQDKGGVLAAKDVDLVTRAVDTQGKGGALGTSAVDTQGKGGVLPSEPPDMPHATPRGGVPVGGGAVAPGDTKPVSQPQKAVETQGKGSVFSTKGSGNTGHWQCLTAAAKKDRGTHRAKAVGHTRQKAVTATKGRGDAMQRQCLSRDGR